MLHIQKVRPFLRPSSANSIAIHTSFSFLQQRRSRRVFSSTLLVESLLSTFVGVPPSDPQFSHKSCRVAMATDDPRKSLNQPAATPKLQIYSTSSTGVSPFWKDKYEREAKRYWDIFYKRHQDKFFKDRHYLDKEWGSYFSGTEKKVLLEVGCGVGNTIYPLLATFPNVFAHACDFSARAVDLVKVHKDFTDTRIKAFVCDLTADDLAEHIPPTSVDIVTMIFVLSAVSPEKMSLVLQNIRKVLKPNGHILFRDYATGDLAQERFSLKDQMISENFYVRGDGTRAFYFSDEFLENLFKENGFDVEEIGLYCKQVENRSRELIMNRRWIQATFRSLDSNETVVDMSEGVALDMFGLSPSSDNETLQVDLKDNNFKIKVLSKEYQHTCKSTGMMLWESARLMASILALNPSIVSGKRVLELGCGCGGICSMISVGSADLVIASDGDPKALDLLTQNIASNIKQPFLGKLIAKRLDWGNEDHILSVKELNREGFEVIIGTDVTYIPEAISPLFATARELISTNRCSGRDKEPALILCHILRRVDEPSILSAASKHGFRLVDNWPSGISANLGERIISSWFPEEGTDEVCNPSTALNIMYFQVEH